MPPLSLDGGGDSDDDRLRRCFERFFTVGVEGLGLLAFLPNDILADIGLSISSSGGLLLGLEKLFLVDDDPFPSFELLPDDLTGLLDLDLERERALVFLLLLLEWWGERERLRFLLLELEDEEDERFEATEVGFGASRSFSLPLSRLLELLLLLLFFLLSLCLSSEDLLSTTTSFFDTVFSFSRSLIRSFTFPRFSLGVDSVSLSLSSCASSLSLRRAPVSRNASAIASKSTLGDFDLCLRDLCSSTSLLSDSLSDAYILRPGDREGSCNVN